MSIKKRILKNSVASMLDKISKVTEQLLLVPFFILCWGVEYYGDWITLTILPTFFALANLGFGTATGNTFVLKYGAGDKQSAANTVKTGLYVMHIGIFFIVLLSLIVLEILGHFDVFSSLKMSAYDAKYAVFFMFTSAVVTFYLAIFECFYRVAHQAHLGIFLKAIATFIKVGLAIAILFAGAHALEFSLLIFIVTLITNIIYIYLAVKFLKFKEYKKSKFNKYEAIFLFKKGLGYFLSPLWQAIYFQGTTFIIRIVLGPSAVVLFNTLRTLINSSSQLFNVIVNAIYPEFQLAIAERDHNKAKKLYLSLLTINVFIALIASIFLIFFGDYIYGWWTHHQINVPIVVWFLMIIRIIFYALWYSYSFVFEANNMPYPLTITGVIVAILSVIVTWGFASLWGVIGGAIGILCFDILMFLILKKLSQSFISVNLKDSIFMLKKISQGLRKG